MITLRPAAQRGTTTIDWLESYHSFSFGEYYDADWMGFRTLRVINDDRIAPGMGFGEHPHRDMEILTYVLSGELEHRDSLGNGSIIRPGDVQVMSAGTGIRHSEFNPSNTQPAHLLQIWMLPEKRGLPPRYAQKNFAPGNHGGQLRVVASRDGRDGSVVIFQDLLLLDAVLAAGQQASYAIKAGRYGWLQVASGSVTANGQSLAAGDGLAITGPETLTLAGKDHAEVLLFDLN